MIFTTRSHYNDCVKIIKWKSELFLTYSDSCEWILFLAFILTKKGSVRGGSGVIISNMSERRYGLI